MAKAAPVRVRDEQGQSAVEHLGAVILAGLIIAGLVVARPGIGELISTGLREAICVIAGDECRSSEDTRPPAGCDRSASHTR